MPPARADPPPLMHRFPRHDDDEDAPPLVPEHRVVRCIGQGGYGRVWMAQSALGAWRAIKVVSAATSHDGRIYERELEAVQRFEPLSREHEGFADILQTGRGGDGCWFYYVMELADDAASGQPWQGNGDGIGYSPQTLSRVLGRRGRLSAPECVELGLRLARSLLRLHRAGLIHRDIKPSNIIFVNGEAKLADIGLVVEQSKARSYVGTHGYIPPDGPNTVQADIYALGMVLYEAAMGLPHEQFPRPSPALRSSPDAPTLREINAIVLRACAPNPLHRYADASELESDIALVSRAGSVRRRRQWALVGTAAPWLALGTAAIGLAAWRPLSASQKPKAPPNVEQAASTALQAARVKVGHGVHLLDNQDPAGALVWFAEALPGMSPSPNEVHAHRLRVAQAMARVPRMESLVHVGDHPEHVAFSTDSASIAVATDDGWVDVWRLDGQARQSRARRLGNHPLRLGFSTDGQRVLAAPFVTDPAIRGASVALGHGFWIDLESGAIHEVAAGIAWAVFSPDGRWMASIKPGNEVWLHATDGKRPARLLTTHGQSVAALQFSPDSQLVASCSTDHTAGIWRVEDGAMACPMLRLPQAGLSLSFSQDSRWLATVAFSEADASSRLQAWSVSTGRALGAPTTVAGAVPFLAPNEVGRLRFLHGSLQGGLSLLEVETGVAVASFSLPRGALRSCAVSPDGCRVAAGGDDGTVCVWDVPAAKPLVAIPVHARAVHWMKFARGGTCLVTASDDGVVRVWNLARSSETEPNIVERPGLILPSQPGAVPGRNVAAIDSSGRFLLASRTQGGHRNPFALDLVTGRDEALPTDGSSVPCGHWMSGHVSATWASAALREPRSPASRDICIWRRSGRRWLFSRISHPASIAQACFTTDDQTLLTYAIDGGIRAWNVASGRMDREVLLPKLPVGHAATQPGGHVALSDDGRRVACLAPNDRNLRVLDWRDASHDALEIPLPAPWKGAHWLSGSPVIAAEVFGRGTLHWHAESGHRIPILTMPPTMRMSAWEPSSQRMLALDHFGGSHLVAVDPPSVSTLMDDSAHCQARDLAFSRDGRLMVVVGIDHHVQVRAVPSGQPVTPKLPIGGRPAWASLTREGDLVVIAAPHHVHQWRLSPAKGTPSDIIDLAHVLSGRRLNAMGQLEFIEPADLAKLAQRLPNLLIAADATHSGP